MSDPATHAIVTGTSGFLGAHVAALFRARGMRVTELVRSPATRAEQVCLPSAQWGEAIAAATPDILIHCAGAASVGESMTDPATDFTAGPALTFGLLDAVRRHAPACRFLFCSSAAIYGDPVALPITEEQPPRPLSPYGFHKLQSEMLCREFTEIYGVATAALRIFSAYGPGLERQVVWDICRRVTAGGAVMLHGTGDETRDFIHATDVAEAAWIVATKAAMRGESYNVATGIETRIADLAAMIATLDGHATTSIAFDGSKTPGNPINWRADIARLRALGFAPAVSLEQGLRDVLRGQVRR